jgi:hypothetical protein
LKVDVTWQVRAEGYKGNETSAPGPNGPTSWSATTAGGGGPTRIAAMTYFPSNSFDVYYDPTVGYFTSIRNDNGRHLPGQ